MPPLIKVVSPNGTVLSVTEEEARDLAVLDYRPASTELLAQRAAVQSEEAYYGGTLDKLQAFGQGAASGISFGAYDLYHRLTADQEDLTRTRKLAEHNPGWRMAGSLAGGLALGGAGGARSLAGTIAEGAAFGAGAGLAETMLSEDPVSAEALVSSMGHGALLGGAVGGAAHGVGGALQRAGSRAKAAAAEFEQRGVDTAYRSFRQQALSRVDEALQPRAPPQRMGTMLDEAGVKALAKEMAQATDEAIGKAALAGQREVARDLRVSLARTRGAKSLAELEPHVATMKAMGFEPPPGIVAARAAVTEADDLYSRALTAHESAVRDATEVAAAMKQLPTSLSGLGRLKPGEAAELARAINKAPGLAEDFGQVLKSAGIQDAVGKTALPDALGEFVGTPAENFLLARELAATMRGARVGEVAGEHGAVDLLDEGKKLVTRGAVRSALGLGVGPGMLAWPAAGVLIRMMHGARTTVSDSLGKWAATGGAVAKGGATWFGHAAARGDALHEEFEREAQPVRERVGSTRDRAWSATEPLRMQGNPKLADRVFEQLVRADEHLIATMPTLAPGPGVLGKEVQRQTREEMQAWLGRQAVVKDPMGAFGQIGQLSPEQTQTLRVVFPGLVEQAKQWVAERLPDLQMKLSHRQIQALSDLFDTPLADYLTESYLRLSQMSSLMEPGPGGSSPGESLTKPAPAGQGVGGMTAASGSGGGGALATEAQKLQGV